MIPDDDDGRIGPGRLVLVVGPSGAGKDTLIRAARAALAGDDRILFPRRLVTRPPSTDEDNVEVRWEDFAGLQAAGGLAFAWSAHGLDYGFPAALHASLATGRTVVCNVSRAIVPGLRARYASARVVAVNAPAGILAARLAGRGREDGADVAARLERACTADVEPDVVVVNDGELALALKAFVAAIR